MLDRVLGSKKIGLTSTEWLNKSTWERKKGCSIFVVCKSIQGNGVMWLPTSKGNLRLHQEKIPHCSGQPRLELCLWFWETLEEGHRATGAHLEDFKPGGARDWKAFKWRPAKDVGATSPREGKLGGCRNVGFQHLGSYHVDKDLYLFLMSSLCCGRNGMES